MGRKIKNLTDEKRSIAKEILEIIESGKSLREACRTMPHYPKPSTFVDWTNCDEKLAEQYARAKDQRTDVLFDEILEIADKADENVQASKLQVDARKWVLSKMKPERYGDKLDLTSGEKPITPFSGFTITDLTGDDK